MTIDHVGLAVADLDAMTAWWASALEASVDYAVDRPAVPMRANVLVNADGFRLELLHRPGGKRSHGRWTVAESLLAHGYGHLALRVDDVEAAYVRLTGMGAASVMEPSPGSQPGMTIAFVADPEENLIEILSRSALTTGLAAR